jgi:DNA-binding SARP family transcriptional activator
VELGVLGQLEVRNGHRIVTVGPGRQAKAMAALILYANQTISTERLITVLWDGDPPSTALQQTQNCVSSLRRQLIAGDVSPDAIQRGPGGYRLETESNDIDVQRFEAAIALAHTRILKADPTAAIAELENALSLWRGPALAGIDSAALQPEAHRLERLRLATQTELAEIRIASGDYQLAAAELSVLCNQNPLQERLHALRMTALAGAGHRAEALALYQTVRLTLRQELGLDPGAELRNAELTILSTGVVPSTSKDRAVEPVPAAARRGVRRPRRSHPVPHQLPPPVADFTGRHGSVAQLTQLLTAPTSDGLVLTGITGLGGVGKTTLAVQVAHRTSSSFPDGQLYARLCHRNETPTAPADVLGRFLRALGVPDRLIPADVDERGESLRSLVAGRRLLMVLDNATAEHQIRPLLPGTPGCSVIVTGRIRLVGLEGCRWLDAAPFSEAEALDLFRRVSGRTDEDATEAEIVRMCDYLPLAVRVAASRLAARPWWAASLLAELLRDEHHRLDELDAGDLSVRATLTHSLQCLGPDARDLLNRLVSLELRRCSPRTVQALLGITAREALRLLGELMEAHVLSRERTIRGIQCRFSGLVYALVRERIGLRQPDALLCAAGAA